MPERAGPPAVDAEAPEDLSADALAAVRRAVRQHLDQHAPPGGPLLVAVSGGADSLALADAVARWAHAHGRVAAGVVVDHRLQTGSSQVAEGAAAAAAGLGLDPVEVLTGSVGRTGGPEAAAREARRTVLAAAARRLGGTAVLLGHTLDDQAETVLLGLARGSGARALAGMRPVADGGTPHWHRPLLVVRRATTRGACAALGVEPWDDPHNADPAFTRARVRAVALPALAGALGQDPVPGLARTADLLRDDADALDAWATQAVAAAGAATGDGALDCAVLADLPAAVRRRALLAAARAAGSPAGSLTAGHAAALDALVSGWRGQGPVALPGGVSASRASGRLRLRRHPPVPRG